MSIQKNILKYFLSILIICPLICLGCQNEQAQSNDITADEFASHQYNADVVILDVRTSREFEQGHIENAILLDVYSTGAGERINQLDKNKVYYVYCHSGVRSRSVVNFMRSLGFEESYNIQGGILSISRVGVKMVR